MGLFGKKKEIVHRPPHGPADQLILLADQMMALATQVKNIATWEMGKEPDDVGTERTEG